MVSTLLEQKVGKEATFDLKKFIEMLPQHGVADVLEKTSLFNWVSKVKENLVSLKREGRTSQMRKKLKVALVLAKLLFVPEMV